jgi:7-cyano-7-deazaguanine synthase
MTMSKKKHALVVFSGGQDSTTCLLWAIRQFDHVEAVTFHYGQRHKQELDCASEIAREWHVPHRILDLSLLHQLAPSALTRSEIAIEHKEGELPTTFVDGRNLLFLSFAAVLAKQAGMQHIVTGVCQTDFSGYPDCRDIFIKSLNVTLNLAMDYEFVIETPLMWMTKAQTWQLADQLGALFFVRQRTLTCYEGLIADGCGTCPACLLRARGLQEYESAKREGRTL